MWCYRAESPATKPGAQVSIAQGENRLHCAATHTRLPAGAALTACLWNHVQRDSPVSPVRWSTHPVVPGHGAENGGNPQHPPCRHAGGPAPRQEPWKTAATASRLRPPGPVFCQLPVRLGRKGAEGSGTIGHGAGALLPCRIEIGVIGSRPSFVPFFSCNLATRAAQSSDGCWHGVSRLGRDGPCVIHPSSRTRSDSFRA